MADNVAKAKAMLSYIGKEVEEYLDDQTLDAIKGVFVSVLERRGDLIKAQYVANEIKRVEDLSADVSKFKEIMATVLKSDPVAEHASEPKEEAEPVAEQVAEPAPKAEAKTEEHQEKKTTGGAIMWNLWKELIENVDIDETKYKYTAIRDHEWLVNNFRLAGSDRMVIVTKLMQIAEALNLGVKHVQGEPRKFPGPVYREFIRQYDEHLLSDAMMAMLSRGRAAKIMSIKRTQPSKVDTQHARIISRPDMAAVQ